MRHRSITLVPSVLFYHLRDVTTSPLSLFFDQAFLEFALHKSLLLHFSLADGSFNYPLVVLKSAAASSLVPVPGFSMRLEARPGVTSCLSQFPVALRPAMWSLHHDIPCQCQYRG